MQITITSVRQMPYCKSVKFTCDGVLHTANLHKDESLSLYEYAGRGDACTKTRAIENDDMAYAVFDALDAYTA